MRVSTVKAHKRKVKGKGSTKVSSHKRKRDVGILTPAAIEKHEALLLRGHLKRKEAQWHKDMLKGHKASEKARLSHEEVNKLIRKLKK